MGDNRPKQRQQRPKLCAIPDQVEVSTRGQQSVRRTVRRQSTYSLCGQENGRPKKMLPGQRARVLKISMWRKIEFAHKDCGNFTVGPPEIHTLTGERKEVTSPAASLKQKPFLRGVERSSKESVKQSHLPLPNRRFDIEVK